MWYCQKCSKWHYDSVSIVKHLQSCNVIEPPSVPEEVKTNPKAQKERVEYMESPTVKCIAKKKENVLQTKTKCNPESKICPLKIVNKTDKPKSILRGSQSSIISLANSKKLLKPQVLSVKKVSNAANQFMVVGNANNQGLVSKISRAYVCKFCCFKFQNKDQLDTHLKSHDGNAKHSCHQCGFIAGTFSALMSHYVKHSSVKTPPEQKLPTNKNVIAYETQKKKEIHDKVLNSFNCKKCKKQFNTRKAFHTHYCPPEDKKTEYICAYCRQVTTTVEDYRDHIQSHTPPLVYTCENCPRKFGYKFQLNKHMQVCLKLKKAAETTSRKRRKPVSSPGKPRKSKPRKPRQTARKAANPPLSEGNSTVIKDNIEKKLNETESKSSDCSITEHVDKDVPIHSKTIKQEENVDIHSRLRPKKARVLYASESSPEDNANLQPTRRSARLVTRKHIRFSRTSSDSESTEVEKIQIEESEPVSNVTAISPPTPLASPKQATVTPSPKQATVTPSPKQTTVTSNIDESAKSPERALSPKENPTVSPPKRKIFTLGKKAKHKVPLKNDPIIEIKGSVLCCNLCSLHFRSIGSLKRHRKMHSGKPQFVCQYCGKFFYRRDIHRRHESNVHQNKLSEPYHCYYCKKLFESSSQLKEHVLSTHSGKALHPERIRRCTPAQEPQSEIVIKKEPVTISPSSKANKSLKLEPLTEFAYQCGICDITFETTPCILKHFEEAHAMSDNLNIVKVPKSDVISIFPPTVRPNKNIQKRKRLASTSTKTLKETNILLKAPEVMSAEASSELKFSWDNGENSCVLCFSKLPEKGTRMCCETDIHKAIDWYECPICFAVGHNRQMREHMFKHLKKIGTFIVNVNDKNFTEINHFVHLKKEEAIKVDEENADDERIVDMISTIHTLIQEVACTRCSENIVDSNLLLSHPCLKQEGIFSCFATNCDVTSNSLSVIQNHLRNFHCFEPQHNGAVSQDINADDSTM